MVFKDGSPTSLINDIKQKGRLFYVFCDLIGFFGDDISAEKEVIVKHYAIRIQLQLLGSWAWPCW